MKFKLLFTTLIVFFAVSCTVQKRLHFQGHYVAWKGHSKNEKSDLISQSKEFSEQINPEGGLTVNNFTDNTIEENEKPLETTNVVENKAQVEENYSLQKKSEVCDQITLKNGNEISCKLIEVGVSEIKYKNCDNQEGPTVIINKSEVLMLKYANGTKEVFSSSNTNNNTVNVHVNTTEPIKNKSQLVALILCIFFGLIGVHRMYLGYVGLGIFYLLTGGFCGIGVLIDLILLITGSLKPKNSEYKDSF